MEWRGMTWPEKVVWALFLILALAIAAWVAAQ
jgi:hypothetical protein